jgi:hypothetical protein
MTKISEEIKTREKISELREYEKNQLDNAITDFLKSHENVLYSNEDLLIELGLNFKLSSLVTHLKDSFRKMELLVVFKKTTATEYKAFYSFSTYCGSRECYYDWCESRYPLCPKGKPNSNL